MDAAFRHDAGAGPLFDVGEPDKVQPLMHAFRDTDGRDWSIDLTIGAVKRVQTLLGVDLLNPLGKRPKKAAGKKRRRRGVPLVTKLQTDVALLVDVIFALVQPQAEEREVDDLAFVNGLGGDAAYDAAQAFMAEWRDFFLSLRRETDARAIDANAALVAAEDKRNLALIDRATEAAERVAGRQRDHAIEEIENLGRGATSTDLPESSGSTPDRSTA